MTPTLNIAVSAARAAGQIILRNIPRIESLKVHEKAPNDFVTEVDHKAEQEIIYVLQKSFPDYGIIAEESGVTEGKEDSQWIIDPLDGTTNYLHGIPHYCVSIALRQNGKLEIGVVYDPIKEELFCASRGNGATLNNRRLRVSSHHQISGSLLATGFPYLLEQDHTTYLDGFESIIKQNCGIRRAGAAALDLAYVAAGRYDGFWEYGLNSWDMAAGVLLVQEAGGLVCDRQGGHNYLKSGEIIASNSRIFKTLVKQLHNTKK